MTTGPLPAPSKCKSGRFNAWGQSSTHRTTLRRWWSGSPRLRTPPGRPGPRSSSKRSRQSLMKFPSGLFGRLPKIKTSHTQLWIHVWRRTWSVGPTGARQAKLGFRRSATTLNPSHTGPLPPPTWTHWTTSFGHTSRISPIWHLTTPKPAWSPLSAEYSPSSRRRLWKRHAPNSGSVSRRWLRLKAATLNICQLYNIIKLPELIFSIIFLKIKAVVLFSLRRQFYHSTL